MVQFKKPKKMLSVDRGEQVSKAPYAKPREASKALRRQEQLPVAIVNEDDNPPVFGDDDEELLHKLLERARKLVALKKEQNVASVPEAVAALAAITNSTDDVQVPTTGGGVTQDQEKVLVFTEMNEFVWSLQHYEETRKPEAEEVFMEEGEIPRAAVEEVKEDVAPVEFVHEVAVGKGLSGALNLLKERGTLKETVEWGGRNIVDKKKSKLDGIFDGATKEIQIERRDEFGRIMTPKEAFRMISHKFHGKGPGKRKQEKRMKHYEEEMKLKKMKNSDTPSESTERMREAQARMKTPYLVLSRNV